VCIHSGHDRRKGQTCTLGLNSILGMRTAISRASSCGCREHQISSFRTTSQLHALNIWILSTVFLDRHRKYDFPLTVLFTFLYYVMTMSCLCIVLSVCFSPLFSRQRDRYAFSFLISWAELLVLCLWESYSSSQ